MFYSPQNSQINKTAPSPELGGGKMYFVTFHLEQKNGPTDKGPFDPEKMLSSTHSCWRERAMEGRAPFHGGGWCSVLRDCSPCLFGGGGVGDLGVI